MSTERKLLFLITQRFKEEFNNADWYSKEDKELLESIDKALEQPYEYKNEQKILDLHNTISQKNGEIISLKDKLKESTNKDLNLRDHFAGLAMQGLATKEGYAGLSGLEYIARDAYALADAMLVEKDKDE